MTPARLRLPVSFLATFVVLAIGLAAVGWTVYRNQQSWLTDVGRRGTANVNVARVIDVLAWRTERLTEANALQSNRHLLSLSAALLSARPTRDEVAAWDETVAWLRTRPDIVGVILLNRSGGTVHAAGAVSVADEVVQSEVATAWQTRRVVLSDPRPAADGAVRSFLCVPLSLNRASALPEPAMLVVEIDPSRGLFSAVKGRGAPGSIAETLLVRRDADGITVLAGVGPAMAPKVGQRFTGHQGTMAADRILTGTEGPFDGANLHGADAIGDARRVGDTEWWILSTVATDAMLAQTRSEAWRIAGVIAVLIAAAGAVLLLVWHRRQAGVFRELYQAESGRQGIAQSYRQLFELANDALVLADAETGVIIDANRKAAELTGRTVEELRGMNHTVLHPPEAAEESRRNLRGRATNEQPGTLEVFLQHRDGHRIPAEVNASRFEMQGRLAILGIFRDLTELKRSREALRRSEEGYRVAAEQTGQLVYDLEWPAGAIEWRGAIEALTGYTPAEYSTIALEDWFGFIHPDDRATVRANFEQARQHMSQFRVEYRYRRKDGSHFRVDDHGVCLPGRVDGGVRVIGTKRDVTADRAAEEELRTSETRRQKLESLALLAGGIAHDFNNLLVGIVGNVSLARQTVPVDDEAHTCLVEAERAGSRAEALTRQLLTFSKGGAPIKKVVDVGRLLSETMTFACRGTSARCEIRLPPEPLTAEVDEGQMAQVINNIAINAVQAMPSGGVLTGTASRATVGPDNPWGLAPGPYVRLALADTGVGMPAPLLDRIFDPYFTTKQQGSGLGLATSHSIVRRHGGDIQVRSEVGVGTELVVLLPASGDAEPDIAPPQEVVLQRGGRLLVMDDEEQVRTLAIRMVTRLGFEAVGVAEGAEAIRAYIAARDAGRPFDLVLMDLTISGGMGGQEAAAELLGIDPRARMIVSSGYSNDPIMANYRDFGFAAVLAKPYRIDQLKVTLAGLLDGPATDDRDA